MGVMPCSRKNCTNILCDTYIDGIGYICDSCLSIVKERIGDRRLPKQKMLEEVSRILEEIDNEGETISLDDLFI